MINFEKATELALKKLEEIESRANGKLVLLESETMTFDYGWVFFYQSEEYVRTLNESKQLGGNAPIIVDKYTGGITISGTSKRIEYYIEVYSKFRSDWYK